jgi:signal peptidase I
LRVSQFGNPINAYRKFLVSRVMENMKLGKLQTDIHWHPDSSAGEAIKNARAKLKCDLTLEALRWFGETRIRVTGTSMLPAVWPGDVLTVSRESADDIWPGEIVFFKRRGRLFAHRLVTKIRRQEKLLLLTRGDRLRHPDPPVTAEEVLGRVAVIMRGNRQVTPRPALWLRIASSILSRSELCTRLLVWLRNTLLGTQRVQTHQTASCSTQSHN